MFTGFIGTPHFFERWVAIIRAVVSKPVPGPKAMIRSIGLVGYLEVPWEPAKTGNRRIDRLTRMGRNVLFRVFIT